MTNPVLTAFPLQREQATDKNGDQEKYANVERPEVPDSMPACDAAPAVPEEGGGAKS